MSPRLPAVLLAFASTAGAATAAPAPDRDPVPPGTYRVVYHPNRAVRTYEVRRGGRVVFRELDLPGRVERREEDWVLDFGDGKLELLTAGRDGRLFVEHFKPAGDYPEGPPDQIGIGTRRPGR